MNSSACMRACIGGRFARGLNARACFVSFIILLSGETECQVSVVLSAITALNSSSRLCVKCVHTCNVMCVLCAFLGAELSHVWEGNTLGASPHIYSESPLNYFQLDIVESRKKENNFVGWH